MEKIILFSMLIILSGCCSTEPIIDIRYKDVYIEVPIVATKPPIYEPIDLPIYYLDGIRPEVIDKKTAEAYYQSLVILIGEVEKRDNDLNVYRNFVLKPEEK